MIKVLGGEKKGKSLLAAGDTVRPTSGKVREALFNILGEKIIGASFLDLFAGTGSVGIEALSRGAKRCTFVEKEGPNFKVLQRNIERVQYQSSSDLHCLDALKYWKRPQSFDILFLDPPYSSAILEKLLPAIGGSVIIPEGSHLVIEHFKKIPLAQVYGRFEVIKRYPYGDTVLSVYGALEEGTTVRKQAESGI